MIFVASQDFSRLKIKQTSKHDRLRRRHRRLKEHSLQVRHTQDWDRGFILLLPHAAVLPGLEVGRNVVKPASSFVILNRQTSCSMWCPMYRARY